MPYTKRLPGSHIHTHIHTHTLLSLQGSLTSARNQLSQLESQLASVRAQLRAGMQRADEGLVDEAGFDSKLQETKTVRRVCGGGRRGSVWCVGGRR